MRLRHEISINVVCATSKASDHPAHTHSLIRAFASRLNILWSFGRGVRVILQTHLDQDQTGHNLRVSKGAKIRNQYKQVPHLTQDTNGKVTNSQLDTTNESQEVSPYPAGDHKAHINRCAQRHSKHKTEQKHNMPDLNPNWHLDGHTW